MVSVFEEVDKYIQNEDWESVLERAKANHDTDNPIVAEKLIECYKLCIKQDMTEAYLNLGTFYYNGVFVEQDFKKAFELYKTAADRGDVRAICNCAYCFYYGRHGQKDYAQAFKYFALGALVYEDINCLYKLGDMYMNGYEVDKNELYAFKLYKKAEEECTWLDDPDEYLGDVKFRIGKCLLNGLGTQRDTLAAYDNLSSALTYLYKRSRFDPFVSGLIKSAKNMIAQAQKELDEVVL